MDSVAVSAATTVDIPVVVPPAAGVSSNASLLGDALPADPSTGTVKQIMHKNLLQQYAQRAGIQLPAYSTINEGRQHAPQFRSTVMVDGLKFRSNHKFSHRKEAEQDVAKLALEGLRRKIRDECTFIISQDTMFSKSILHEFAAKISKEKPTYATSQSVEVLHPFFRSSVVFDGKTYTSGDATNKREAEQLGARAVILSILANSDATNVNVMSQIIKSKCKIYGAMPKTSSSGTPQLTSVALTGQVDHGSSCNSIRGKAVQGTCTDESCHHLASRQLSTAVQSCPLCTSSGLPEFCGKSCYTSVANHEMPLIGPVLQPRAYEDATASSQGKRLSIGHEKQDWCKRSRRELSDIPVKFEVSPE